MTNAPPTRHVQAHVRGRVQGVAFRLSLREQAHRLGVTGSARNLPDGSVEVHLQGTPAAVDAALAWCHSGPPRARVDHVTVFVLDPDPALEGFTVG